MTQRPKIETADQAYAYFREWLDNHRGSRVEAQVLWYVEGRQWWIGVKDGSDREVWIVGPRGGLRKWIHLGVEEKEWLKEWL